MLAPRQANTLPDASSRLPRLFMRRFAREDTIRNRTSVIGRIAPNELSCNQHPGDRCVVLSPGAVSLCAKPSLAQIAAARKTIILASVALEASWLALFAFGAGALRIEVLCLWGSLIIRASGLE